MNYDEALKIYIDFEETSLQKLKLDLMEAAVRYSIIRVQWRLTDLETKLTLEQERTIAHNSFIDCCNILSRNMSKANENTKWREKLGNDRKRIGDFACFLFCILGIEAR